MAAQRASNDEARARVSGEQMQGHPSQVRMRMQIQQLEAQVRQSEGRTQRAAAAGAQLQLLREADFSRFDALRAQQREEAAADAQRQAKLLAQARTELRRPPHACPRPRFTHPAATHLCSVSPTPTPHRARGPPKLRAPCGRCAPSATRASYPRAMKPMGLAWRAPPPRRRLCAPARRP